ncbi:unnamed protein product [Mytilus edulis]|uniref:Mab-21-like nucleotidyltransferase domain-containing protein n=1 Tax=Mytilus edulis TaxID=6550 RepID=A0A8S3RYX7_MYTED|nr:unnamed protein product [Mytilus edulis]
MRKKREKARAQFTSDPFQFTSRLLGKKGSGHLKASLEEYLSEMHRIFRFESNSAGFRSDGARIILYDTDLVGSWSHVNQPAFHDKPLEFTLRSEYEGPYNVTNNGCLVPLKVKKHFRHLVGKAIDYLTNKKTDDRITIENLSDSPAVTFTVKQRDEDDLGVDMAPMINVKLPFKDEFGWPKHGAEWPSQRKVQQIKVLE